MAIELFEHNQTAYQAALYMLKTAGKAAIIHPTGTGKSFIGFKLCEDFPEKIVCWLSPSEYIFRTQVENLAANTGKDVKCLENVRFYTYAKLMSMTEEELGEIRPDYIILYWMNSIAAVRPSGDRGCISYCLCIQARRCWGFRQRRSDIWTASGICRMSCSTEMWLRR